MMKKKLLAGAALVLFAAAVLWRLLFAQQEATVDTAPLAVTVQRVATRDVSLPVTFTGSIEGTQ